MSEQTTPWPEASNDVLEALAHHRRRRVLRILRNNGSTRLEDVTTQVVAQETHKMLRDVRQSEVKKVLIGLTSFHLPRLTEVGLVDRNDQVVSTTDHPALQDPKIKSLLAPTTSEWDDVVHCLANEYRRVILTTVAHNGGVMERRQLATEVTAMIHSDATDEVVERVLQEFHHLHLPKLDEAGLVWYDIEEKMIGSRGHSLVERLLDRSCPSRA